MSNSIWKIPEENPDGERLYVKEDNDGVFVCLTNKVSEDAIRWAYIDDLIAQADKAERLQKAVDKALYTLDYVSNERFATEDGDFFEEYEEMHKAIEQSIDEIKQLIKGE